MKTRVKVSSIFWFSVLYVCDGIYVMGMMKVCQITIFFQRSTLKMFDSRSEFLVGISHIK